MPVSVLKIWDMSTSSMALKATGPRLYSGEICWKCNICYYDSNLNHIQQSMAIFVSTHWLPHWLNDITGIKPTLKSRNFPEKSHGSVIFVELVKGGEPGAYTTGSFNYILSVKITKRTNNHWK